MSLSWAELSVLGGIKKLREARSATDSKQKVDLVFEGMLMMSGAVGMYKINDDGDKVTTEERDKKLKDFLNVLLNELGEQL